MPPPRPISPARLLGARMRARAGLLVSAATAFALAVATVCIVTAWTAHAIAVAGETRPPGLDDAEFADLLSAGEGALLAALPALVVLVVVVAGTAVAQLARLIAAAREHETETIRARGLSHGQSWAMNAVEGTLIALAGAVVGGGLGWGLAALLAIDAAALGTTWLWALATVVVLLAVFLFALRRSESARSAGRAARATTAALVVLVLLASALVLWQLPSARAEGFDPIVATAPAVVLLAGSLVALALVGAVASAWARPAAALRGLQPGYPARQVARRLPIYAVAVLLVALTTGQIMFASTFDATWRATVADSAAVRAGADLRVDVAPQTVSAADVASASEVAGIDAAASGLTGPVEIGATDADLVALPSEQIDAVVASAGGIVDPAALARAVRVDDTAAAAPLDLGDGATGLTVRADLSTESGGIPAVQLAVVLVDAAGTPATVPLYAEAGANEAGGVRLVGEAALPGGTAPWRILAVTAGLGPTAGGRSATVTLAGAEAIGGVALDIDGSAELVGASSQAVLWLGAGGGTAQDGPPPVAAVVSTDLATRLGIGVGDTFEFRYAGSGRVGEVVVSAVDDVIPGASSRLAFFAPLDALLASQLQRGTSIVAPNSVWAAGERSADDGLSAALGDRRVLVAAPGVAATVVGALVPGWWIATAGTATLAIIAALAIVQTLSIARRRELGVLRALGVTGRQQARMRASELAGVFAAALGFGLACGAAVSWLVVPHLVGAVTPGILTLAGGVSVTWVPLALAVGGFVVALAAVVVVAAARVARSARAATVGEEAR